MMRFLIGFGLAVLLAVVSADTGYYIPRAYYTIDENGKQGPVFYIDSPHHRARRASTFTSTSSSTSTSTGSGAPIFFNPLPGFGFPNPQLGVYPGINPGVQGQQSFSGVSTSTSSGGSGGSGGSLDNRFGGDDVKVTGQTQTLSTQNGQFTQTSSHLGDDGKIHFTVQSGKF